jgi:prephenate dehydratase
MTKNTVSVAIQGEEGSYHDKAARHYFGDSYKPRYCKTFGEVFNAVAEGQTDYGLSAVENSLVGSITPVYDLLRATPQVAIVGEIFLGIHHSLIALPGAKISDITDVYSHPVALDQCREFLKRELPSATTHPASDTAGSVTFIKEQGNQSAAAIASADNAARCGLKVLHEGIEDSPKNYTRFLVLGKDGATRLAPEADKTSLLVERLTDKVEEIAPGTLYAALGCFAKQAISLTKIESRPIQGQPWRYVFYIDFLAGTEESGMKAALRALDGLGATWRILGTYRAGETVE